MRKIETIVEKARREGRNKMIIGILLVFLMVFSTVGYAFYYTREGDEESNEETYNGLKFINNGNLWLVNIEGYDFSFMFHPKDIENVSINMTHNINNYTNKPLYFVNNSGGINEISRNLYNFIPRMQEVCYGECEKDLPVKNCTDNLIIFQESEYDEINQKDNCIFIRSKGEQIKVSDAFLYRILGIR